MAVGMSEPIRRPVLETELVSVPIEMGPVAVSHNDTLTGIGSGLHVVADESQITFHKEGLLVIGGDVADQLEIALLPWRLHRDGEVVETLIQKAVQQSRSRPIQGFTRSPCPHVLQGIVASIHPEPLS